MLGLIPLQYKAAAIALIAVAVFLGGYFKGRAVVQEKWDAAKLEAQLHEAKVAEQRANVTTKVVTKYVDRVKVVKEQADEIVVEVPKYIGSDEYCPSGVRLLHDAAVNQVRVPDAARNADASPVPAQDVAATVAENYGTCHQTAEQLKSLQDWIREQQKVK